MNDSIFHRRPLPIGQQSLYHLESRITRRTSMTSWRPTTALQPVAQDRSMYPYMLRLLYTMLSCTPLVLDIRHVVPKPTSIQASLFRQSATREIRKVRSCCLSVVCDRGFWAENDMGRMLRESTGTMNGHHKTFSGSPSSVRSLAGVAFESI